MTWFHGGSIHGVSLAVGMLLGIMHAVGIWRSAQHLTATTAVIGMLRLLCVALVLVAAAIFGGILSAAAGWVVGFATSMAVVMTIGFVTRRRRTVS